MKLRYLLLLPALALFSCGGDKKDDSGSDSLHTVLHADTDSAKVFIVPAPLQVSTLILETCPKPELNLLAKDAGPVSETEYNLALNFGVCLADAGYAGLYNQRQLTLNYLSRAESLARKLHLDNFSAAYFSRVRTNIDRSDSLSAILLSLYGAVQQELNGTGKERVAFFVMSGAYIENLHITLSSKQFSVSPAFATMLGQQEVWLNSLTESLTYLPQDDDTQDLYSTFYTLQHYFEPANMSKSGSVYSASMIPEDLDALRDKTEQLRNAIVKS